MSEPSDSAHPRLLLTHESVISVRCDAPAPLVVNGATYVGCQLSNGHDGPHKIEVFWR